jgi:hypothetical protein
VTWTYDAGQILNTPMMQVRYLVGDTKDTDRQVQDEEIGFALQQRPSVYGAAAIVCRALSAQKSRLVDTVNTADLRTTLSQQAGAYARQAIYYEQRDRTFGGVIPVAGGLTRSSKIRMETDCDRLPPAFNIGMMDNYYPVAPEGNELTPPIVPDGTI